jgi:hypothetical protein
MSRPREHEPWDEYKSRTPFLDKLREEAALELRAWLGANSESLALAKLVAEHRPDARDAFISWPRRRAKK